MTMSYDQGADVYHRVMAPILAGARRPLLEASPYDGVRSILDIGTGPGLLLRELRALCPTALIVGVDLSSKMLALASKDFPLARMDANHLAFRDSSFEGAFMSFVLTSFPHPDKCLREAKRVLREGGFLGTATWQARESEALRQWVSVLDEAGASPVEDRSEVADEPAKIVKLLDEAGFTETRSWTSSFSFTLEASDFMALRTKLGMSAQRLKSIPAETRAKLIREFENRLKKLSVDERTEKALAVLSTSTVRSP